MVATPAQVHSQSKAGSTVVVLTREARASVADTLGTDIPPEHAVLETRFAVESSGSNMVWCPNSEANTKASSTPRPGNMK